ncbi:uncharacterized protein PG986_001300 [Apiospora aurea]|uniref:Polyketide synthase n=1 Tax=Apiospora aurea TaxID=335848 RepID=A0ABR1QX75_9PEZI
MQSFLFVPTGGTRVPGSGPGQDLGREFLCVLAAANCTGFKCKELSGDTHPTNHDHAWAFSAPPESRIMDGFLHTQHLASELSRTLVPEATDIGSSHLPVAHLSGLGCGCSSIASTAECYYLIDGEIAAFRTMLSVNDRLENSPATSQVKVQSGILTGRLTNEIIPNPYSTGYSSAFAVKGITRIYKDGSSGLGHAEPSLAECHLSVAKSASHFKPTIGSTLHDPNV